MKLASAQVGVPIYVIRSTVEHSVVRKPTVFERMIMRLIRRGQEVAGVGAVSLRQAFEEHLAVEGIPRLLEGSVNGLLQMNILRSIDQANGPVLDEPIRTLRLTPEGDHFYNTNTLPSQPSKDAVEYYYLPWSNSLIASRPPKLASAAPEHSFEANKLAPSDPSSLTRQALQNERPRFLKQEARVIAVEADVDDTVTWLRFEVELQVTAEGYLELQATENKPVNDWMARLEPSVVQDALLDHFISRSTVGNRQLLPSILSGATQLQVVPSNAERHESTLIELATGESGSLTIELNSQHSSVRWSSALEGQRLLECPAPTSLPTQLAAITLESGSPLQCTLEGELALTWANRVVYANARVGVGSDHAHWYWAQLSDELAVELSGAADPTIAALPLIWGSTRPIDLLSQRLTVSSISDILKITDEFVQGANVVAPEALGMNATNLLRAISVAVDTSPQLERIDDIQQVDEWVRVLPECMGKDPSLGAVAHSLLARMSPPTNSWGLRAMTNLARVSKSMPPHLLNTEVVALLLDDLWLDPTTDFDTGGLDVLLLLEAFRTAQTALDSALGRQSASLTSTGQRVTANRSIGEAHRAAVHWLNVVNDLTRSRAVGDVLPIGVVGLRDDLLKWREAASSNLAPLLPPHQEALVFDSNSLLDHSDALQNLLASQIGVIPLTVIHELDGLKRNENHDTAKRAREAIRAIDNLRPLGSLRFEAAHPALIPPDFGPDADPDNQILSVAIAFSNSKVTLITSDKNLRNKAQATHIEATSWPLDSSATRN
jgi:rRNA-processing protein FCF1